VATQQQDKRIEIPNQERSERAVKVERPRRDVMSWFSFSDWRAPSSAEEWALA